MCWAWVLQVLGYAFEARIFLCCSFKYVSFIAGPHNCSPLNSGIRTIRHPRQHRILGGSWVVINGVRSPLICVILTVTRLIAPLITTHEPPSTLKFCEAPCVFARSWPEGFAESALNLKSTLSRRKEMECSGATLTPKPETLIPKP